MNVFHKMIRSSLIILGLVSAQAQASPGDYIQALPVQEGGRIKPYDTFARESLDLIYGSDSFHGRSAADVVLTWMLVPEFWNRERVIEIRHAGLRQALKLEGKDNREVRFTPEEVSNNERIPLLMQELETKRKQKAKLDPYYQAVQRLENQLVLLHAIRQGEALRVFPDKSSDTWLSVNRLPPQAAEAFGRITSAFIQQAAAETAPKGGGSPAASGSQLQTAVTEFLGLVRAEAPEVYNSSAKKLTLEIQYNALGPFRWAWAGYLLAALFLWAFGLSDIRWFYRLAGITCLAGFLIHTYGMGLRVYLLGRPPVSNMFETVVWVPWVALVLAFIFEGLYRQRLVLLSALLLSVLCLILTDMAPTILDASLTPLEPVLMDNFWLTTHVLIIVSSYAAFFMAFVLGDLVLLYYLRDEKKYEASIKTAVNAIYRVIQVGVVLLASGIILGGIWADYSWGRFWGWDPKETWALIALLGYIAILHGRLTGWIRQFGLAAYSVVAFGLVIMAWYGVNFVLGAGLHSYGFGAGGVEYVAAFVAAHVVFVIFVAVVRQSRLAARETK